MENIKREFHDIFNNINIIYPKKYDSLNDINLEEDKFDFSTNPISKGIIIYIDNTINTIIKLQNFKYQFYKAIGPEKHIFNGFIDLYMKDKLKDFMKNNNNHIKFHKIINPYNNHEAYDMIGCIDSMFKSISLELFNVYSNYYDIKHKKEIFSPTYKNLPINYKKIVVIAKNNNFKNIHDFYSYLKSIDVKDVLNLIKNRKLFHNWVASNKKDYSFIFQKSNKLRSKLTAVYVSKLFPEIIKTEVNYPK